MDLTSTIELMMQAHHGQMDKSGRPYYLHPLRVMVRLGDVGPFIRQIALLHDVVEDTALSLNGLKHHGFESQVIQAVDLLTRRDGESHGAYITRLIDSKSVPALRVKLADIYDNMSPARVESLPESERGLVKRYVKDEVRILEALGSDYHILKGDL